MPKSPEQFNPELDPSEEVTQELKSPEQELELKGQQLAAQIKDMHANAKTKEDYAAVETKIAELREMFETEEQEIGEKVYRELDEVFIPVAVYVTKSDIKKMETWPWIIRSNENKTYVELGEILIDNNDLLKFDPISLEEERSRFNGPFKTMVGKGFQALEAELKNRKVLSHLVDESWFLEVEPQSMEEGRDLRSSYDELIDVLKQEKLYDGLDFDEVWFSVSSGGYVSLNLPTNGLDLNNKFKFDAIAPEDYDLQLEMYGAEFPLTGRGIKQLIEYTGEKKAKVYNINNQIDIQVLFPEIPSQGIKSLIEQTIKELYPTGQAYSPDEFHWKVASGNSKYINTGQIVSTQTSLKSKVFQRPTKDEFSEINLLDFPNDYGVGFDSLADEMGGPNVKAKSLDVNGKWYIKIED